MEDQRLFRLRYVGPRFTGARMPLDVLPDLPAFRDLLVAYVKAGWREAHAERERLPKGFVRGLKFDLVGIEDGSAIPAIQWDSNNAQLQLPDFRDEMENLIADAFAKIVRLIEGADAQVSTESLNPEEVRALSKFGSGLQEGERIDFIDQVNSLGNVVYLDAYRRKLLLTRGRNSYEVRFDSVGRLLGSVVDQGDASGHIEISTTEHNTLSIPISPERVKSEFDGKIGADVQFRLIIELDENDRLLEIAEVLEIDLIDAEVTADLERCRSRIDVLSSLSDGWHDGSGKSPTDASIKAAYRLLARKPGLAAKYSIFPTDGGGLLFEFAIDVWEYSIEIGSGGQAEIFGVESDGDGEMDTGVLDVDGDEFRVEFDSLTDSVGER